ncbi:MAG: hypothetical protein IKU93_02835 [Alistipes sp.]|nr:hypothetical protein [Alistipes sp.]
MAERKRIGVPISGIDTSTPDHSVTDGKCAELHNLRYTGGAWRNVKDLINYSYQAIEDMEPFSSADTCKIIYKHSEYLIIYLISCRDTLHELYAVRYDEETGVFDTTPLFIASRTFEDGNRDINATDIFHFGNILHFMWDNDKEPQWYLRTEGQYVLYQIDDIHFSITETLKTNAPLPEEIDSPKGIVLSGEPTLPGDEERTLYDYVVKAVDLTNHQTLLRTFDNDEAWRGSICYFLAARAEDGAILAQSPLRILSSSSPFVHQYSYTYLNVNNAMQTDFFWGSQIAAGLGVYKDGSRLYGGINVGGGFDTFDSLSEYNKIKTLNEGTSPSTVYIKPTVSFDIIDSLGEFSSNIFDVALYCTRIHPLFTVDSMSRALPGSPTLNSINNYVSATSAYQAEELPTEPFFLAATRTIAELKTIASGKRGEFLLDRSVLEHIESKGILFEAQSSEHDMSSSKRKEINNSLHIFGDITTRFRKAYNNEKEMAKFQKPANYTPDDQDEWLNKPQLKYIGALIKAQEDIYQSPLAELNLDNGSHPLFYQCGSIISYPDYRAYELKFTEGIESDAGGDKPLFEASYQLKSAPAINYAYYIPPYGGTETAPNAGLKYPIIWPYTEAQDGSYNMDGGKTSLITKGKVWASKDNNPTAYPFERSYTIGSPDNEIIAINSAAIEMSDSKFGEFPVFAFTKEGVYAMQSGKETLYSAIIPINYDVIINPHTLAVNGAVLYFTDKGLHALSNQGAVLLSEPIHTADNRIPDWMRTSEMIYLPEWNEVLCTDLANNKAYVFSLDNKVWSTRDIPRGYILNNDEMVVENEYKIYNLRNEEETITKPKSCKVVTRPIKLGSMELKRAETMIVRFECSSEQDLRVKIKGSINGETNDASWQTLRNITTTTNKDIVIRRTPFSVKYLRFTIEGDFNDNISILAFELEYYNRMRHRMR